MTGEDGKSQRQLTTELTELMARLLHYQDRGEPDRMHMSAEQIINEWRGIDPAIRERYRTDITFHGQVTRAVAMILRVMK